jgi:hypothetical protein
MIDAVAEPDVRVPLMVGAIGHRDLVAAELGVLKARVREFLDGLQRKYPHLRVTLLTSLADGADRLVGDVAQSLRMPIVYVLPMPSDLYEHDFGAESRAEYREILGSNNVLTLPLVGDNTADDVTHPGPQRDLQYAQLGAFIAAHCHILLALWDGRDNGGSGGTAQIIRYHQDDYMPVLADDEPKSRLDDADDESDLVYHVVCSRDRADGAPIGSMRPGEAWWFSRDQREPRTHDMPARYEIVLGRMVEFSLDVVRYRERIARADNDLLTSNAGAEVGEGHRDIADTFAMADWLAKHYQRMRLNALRLVFGFAALAGVTFVAYGDLQQQTMIYLYLVFIAAMLGAAEAARRGAWHRKYVDYRALAEALRVQFYWAVAGVEQPAPSRFGHDAFLKREDLEIGWLRNILRIAGRRDDAGGRVARDEGIEVAVRDWVGDDRVGQLGYYRRRWSTLFRRHGITEVADRVQFTAGLLIAAWLAAAQYWFASEPTDFWVAMMGILPLGAGLRSAFAHRVAEDELILLFQYMDRVMSNARRQLQRATQPSERRRILRELGNAALQENGQWLLKLRERPITAPS